MNRIGYIPLRGMRFIGKDKLLHNLLCDAHDNRGMNKESIKMRLGRFIKRHPCPDMHIRSRRFVKSSWAQIAHSNII